MKKLFALMLIFVFVLSFVGCDDASTNADLTATPTATVTPGENVPTNTPDGTNAPETEATNTPSATAPSTPASATPTPAHEHTWGKWTLKSNAFIGKTGKDVRTCSSCNATEERDRTTNEMHNSLYDGGLQYLINASGISSGNLLNYARHQFLEYMYKETPSSVILDELAKRFNLTNDLKQGIIDIGKDMAKYSTEEYNPENDTWTLNYAAESGNFMLEGYVHNGGKNYTVYYSFSEFSAFDEEETYWKVETEYNRANGTPNRYTSVAQIETLPSNMVKAPEGHNELYG